MISDHAALSEKAKWVWRETLKVHRRAAETRIASSLSPIEIFVALYYGGVLRFDPKKPWAEERDRCIISKGHGSICMYPILADLGFFPMSELERVCVKGGFLGGIPDPVIPGYETVNGSLGHGAGVGTGMALGLKRKKSDRSVFVIVGDGELHEGANWEAFMFASHHKTRQSSFDRRRQPDQHAGSDLFDRLSFVIAGAPASLRLGLPRSGRA